MHFSYVLILFTNKQFDISSVFGDKRCQTEYNVNLTAYLKSVESHIPYYSTLMKYSVTSFNYLTEQRFTRCCVNNIFPIPSKLQQSHQSWSSLPTCLFLQTRIFFFLINFQVQPKSQDAANETVHEKIWYALWHLMIPSFLLCYLLGLLWIIKVHVCLIHQYTALHNYNLTFISQG